ncbi:MAG TPA: hypothetical protein DCM05_01785 [Elusimicrobia bacterium]|nr:hypothetical protein [Elusimicrobiota bacterium]
MTAEEVLAKALAKFPRADKADPVKDYPTLRVSAGDLLGLVRYLKELGFSYLDMVSAVDWKGPVSREGFVRAPGFNALRREASAQAAAAPAAGFRCRDEMTVVYCLTHPSEKLKVFLKTDLPREGGRLPSLAGLFKAADWQEREVFDLFGIVFEGHPDLRKILTPAFLQGHPLRKDYAHVKDRFD